VAVISAGNYFGELGPFLNLPRSASARGRSPCRLTAYPLRAFRQRFPAAMKAAEFGREA
jgi:CRP-like cAMP-binding protein